ncbi:hypothetical protein [Cupriavidus gilardii]|uniref:hypothetical protein n=1 Tax=Cupriavidus gilardii TaxID=82541 RepID=UPI0021B1A897|nr:hypothetical protein [Cupriavidus gilardii]UXC37982.1 hypothetical protein N4G38_23085 [Cupriavidus gilardii]
MTAGEVHRPVLEPIRSATPSIARAWSHLADVASAKPDHDPSQSHREHRDESIADAVAAVLAADDSVPPAIRQAVQGLLQRHRQLEADVARLRAQREEWIVNVLTYQALYHRYSGQTLHDPSDRLMRERDSMRRTIREQLRSGTTPTAMFDLPPHSVSSV